MESSKAGDVPVSFVQQMLHNNMLLLAVVVAVSGAAYFIIGLFMMIGH